MFPGGQITIPFPVKNHLVTGKNCFQLWWSELGCWHGACTGEGGQNQMCSFDRNTQADFTAMCVLYLHGASETDFFTLLHLSPNCPGDGGGFRRENFQAHLGTLKSDGNK